MDTQEKIAYDLLGDAIYDTLKKEGIKENRAFIADVVSVALWELGYRKLPKVERKRAEFKTAFLPDV